MNKAQFLWKAMVEAHPHKVFDLMLKKQLKCCIDWSKISKANYMNAMIISSVDSSVLQELLKRHLPVKSTAEKCI